MIGPRSALFLIAVAVLAAAAPAFAQTKAVEAKLKRIAQTYDRCMAKAVTNPDYGACGGARTQADDALLNETWRGVYGGMDNPEGKAALLDEQRAWIAYKDKSCLWNLEGQGREGQVIHFPQCRSTVIEDRILDLTVIGQ
jgi:uncharacterized protein YecT (DUF1311 family)